MRKIIAFLLMLSLGGCTTQDPFDKNLTEPTTAITTLAVPQQDDIQSVSTALPSVFKVVEAPAGELNADTLGAEASVQVSYPAMALRDTVGIRLAGVVLRDASIQTVSTVGTLTFKVPKAWVTENRNRTVSLTFTYKVGGAGNLITSSPLSIRVVGAQGQSVFKVVEAPTGELNADTLGTEANVQVSYPAMALRDTVGIRLSGVVLRDASIQTVSTVGTLTFKVPKAWVTENRNRTVSLTFTYKVGGAGNLITSSPLSIRVVGAQGQSVFKVVEAPTGELNADTLGTEANVQVSYPAMALRDTVGIRLAGVVLRDALIQTVSTVGTLTFKVPKAWVTENRNRTVSLTFTYKVGGAGNLITSSPLSIVVVGAQGQSVFKVVEAPTGELNADTLGTEANVQVSDPAMAPRDTVGIRLSGVVLRDAPIQTVSTAGTLTFKLPKAWVTENLNRIVNLTYTYKVGGAGSLITSAALPIKVTGTVSDGERAAIELNQQYATTSNVCPGNKAAFYCSGVLIRTVDDSTAFHAWNPSPSAVKLGGVSFSYMKIGIGMNRLQGSRTQGFVLEPAQLFTVNGRYPLQVLCSYPYDGGTTIRSSNGCGATSTFPNNSGPCTTQGINTLAAWRTHFQQYPATSVQRYYHQCSFGTAQAAFAMSLDAREKPEAELVSWSQNEVVIKTWPQNTSNLPIKAFIYFSTASRAVSVEGAKNIQRDFLKMTGRRIPVVRVTPNVTSGNIFSYFAADQGI